MLYDPEKKKTFFSLISAYKDILVYFIFFGIVICGWALIGSRALTFDPTYVDPNFPQNVDPYKSTGTCKRRAGLSQAETTELVFEHSSPL